MSKKDDRSKNWIFTLNGITEWNTVEGILKAASEKCLYICGQGETGESGNKHIQGYLQLRNRQRLAWLRKNISDTAHWEIRRGSHEEAKAYATKEESRSCGPYEFGTECAGPGARTDILSLKRTIDEGKSMLEISDLHFEEFLKYSRGITTYRLLRQPKRDWQMDVRVLWGKTGTGKTRTCYEFARHERLEVYPLSQNYSGGVIWWDGYSNQDIILIDDFYGWIPISYLLKLLDRYPFLLRTHQGFEQFQSHYIFITSNQDPNDWYPNAPSEVRAALRRRFTIITHFTSLE